LASTFFPFDGFFFRITVRKSESPEFSTGGVVRHLEKRARGTTLRSDLNIHI
jgi:hypothetical protein